jgi:D-apionate oxidoisomerase
MQIKPLTVTLLGAGGKMGTRISENLRKTKHRLLCVEVSPAGQASLQSRGLTVTPESVALREADVVIMAVPDHLIANISAAIVPTLRAGATVLVLDPAAPCAGRLVTRPEINFVAAHPCHPPIFGNEDDPNARKDFFGGIAARQDVVVALVSGQASALQASIPVIRQMYSPVATVHEITIDQMALLEPALSETTIATCLFIMKEAIDEVVKRGVPAAAARAFALGHINIIGALTFGAVEGRMSDAAYKAVERAKPLLFRDDWKKVFEPESNAEALQMITAPR